MTSFLPHSAGGAGRRLLDQVNAGAKGPAQTVTVHVAHSPPCDSPEGARIMMDIARAGGLVLGEAHRRLALKHGVPTDGVLFQRTWP